jgi:hypothetical protein
MKTTDIEMCIENENLAVVRDSAEEQLDALIARVQEAEHKNKIDMEQCNLMTDNAAVYATRISELERENAELKDTVEYYKALSPHAEQIEQARKDAVEEYKKCQK